MKIVKTLMLTCLSVIVFTSVVSAQQPAGSPDTSVEIVDESLDSEQKEERTLAVKPVFKGSGLHEFRFWVARRLVYPPEAARLGMTGTAIVEFIIDKKGRVTNVKAIDATSPLFAEEAVRVVRHSPRWTPGVADTGEAVRVKYTLPVNFKLR